MNADQPILTFTSDELIKRHDPLGRLTNYLMFLGAENQRINLVSRETGRRGLMRLMAESLLPLEVIDGSTVSSYLDIGSGGGLPAVPLILSGRLGLAPGSRPVLCERRQKKAAALRRICLNLGLKVSIIPEAIDQASLDETFDLITLRAVKLSAEFLEVIKPRLSKRGTLIYWDRTATSLISPRLDKREIAYQLDNQEAPRHISLLSCK